MSRITVASSETKLGKCKIIHIWNIANFNRICPTRQFDYIHSTHFRGGKEVNRDTEWRVGLGSFGGYVQVYLNLMKNYNIWVKNIPVRKLTLLILGRDGSVLHQQSETNLNYNLQKDYWHEMNSIPLKKVMDNYLWDNKLSLQIEVELFGDIVC